MVRCYEMGNPASLKMRHGKPLTQVTNSSDYIDMIVTLLTDVLENINWFFTEV